MSIQESYWVACMLLICMLQSHIMVAQKVIKQQDVSKAGGELLNCGEMSNLSDVARCLTNRFTAAKLKTASAGSSSGNYGYPFHLAPPLPFLRHEPDHPPSTNSIEGTSRRFDGNRPIERRMQGFSQPEYRNFLDLDSTFRHRAVEYRPVFQIYHSTPVVLPSKDPYYDPDQDTNGYFPKPVKTHSKDYNRRRKQGKVSTSTPNSPDSYQHAKKHFTKSPTYKYNSGYITDSQYTKGNSYDTEYYVPANSPIMGDIRRSLMDYTGARDLMDDEPDYLSSAGIRRFRVEEIQQDYYPFRRSDVNIKDLVMRESKTASAIHKPTHQ